MGTTRHERFADDPCDAEVSYWAPGATCFHECGRDHGHDGQHRCGFCDETLEPTERPAWAS